MPETGTEALNEAKKKRRFAAKSSVTRAGNGLDCLLKNDRPIPEVEESLANFEALYKKLVEKHEEYLTVILRTRVVYELIADEVRSTELAIRHIRRE